jgi:uncharacterized protein with PhoU and TrkA domain
MATIQEKIKLLSEEVNVLYTTIDTLNGRIAALKLEATKEMTESEKMQEELEPIPFNTFT